MDRRGFIRSLGFIAGGLAFGGVKAVKGVAKAAIAEPAKPTFEFPIVRKVYAKTVDYDVVPVTQMAEPIGHVFYMKPSDAWNEMTKILTNNIASDINDKLINFKVK